MISLHVLVRDEAELLPTLLERVKPLVEEMIVVVDDRTTDGSDGIAASHGARVLPYPLDHDFAAARNYGLAQVTQPWVLWLDADERLSPELEVWFRKFLKRPPDCEAIAFRRQNLIDNRPIGDHTYEWHVRLFRSYLRCAGRIHERIVAPTGRLRSAPMNCLLFHHKTQERQELRNEQYMEWPEQRALVGGNG